MSSHTLLIERFSPLTGDSPDGTQISHQRSRRGRSSKMKKSKSQTQELATDTTMRRKRTRAKANKNKDARRDMFVSHATKMDSDGDKISVGGSTYSSSSAIIETSPSENRSCITSLSSPLNSDSPSAQDTAPGNFNSGDAAVTTRNASSLMSSPSLVTDNICQLTDGGAALKLKLGDLLRKTSSATQTPQGKHFHKVLTNICQGAVLFVDGILQCHDTVITPDSMVNTPTQQGALNSQFQKAVIEMIQCVNLLASMVLPTQQRHRYNPGPSNCSDNEQWYQDPMKYLNISGLVPADGASCLHPVEGVPTMAGSAEDLLTTHDNSEHGIVIRQEDINVGMEVVVSSSEHVPSEVVHNREVPVISDVYSVFGDEILGAGSVRANRSESRQCGWSSLSVSAQSSYTSQFPSHTSSLNSTDSLISLQPNADQLMNSEPSRSVQSLQCSDPCTTGKTYSSLSKLEVAEEAGVQPLHVSSLVNDINSQSGHDMVFNPTALKNAEDATTVEYTLPSVIAPALNHTSDGKPSAGVDPSRSEPLSSVLSAIPDNADMHVQPGVICNTAVISTNTSSSTANTEQSSHIEGKRCKSNVSLAGACVSLNQNHMQVDSRSSTCLSLKTNGLTKSEMLPVTHQNCADRKSHDNDTHRRKYRLSRSKNGANKTRTRSAASQTLTKEETMNELLTELKKKLRRSKNMNSPASPRSAHRKRSSSNTTPRKRNCPKLDLNESPNTVVKKLKVDAVPQNITLGRTTSRSNVADEQVMAITGSSVDTLNKAFTAKCDIGVQANEKHDASIQTDPVQDAPELCVYTEYKAGLVPLTSSVKQEPTDTDIVCKQTFSDFLPSLCINKCEVASKSAQRAIATIPRTVKFVHRRHCTQSDQTKPVTNHSKEMPKLPKLETNSINKTPATSSSKGTRYATGETETQAPLMHIESNDREQVVLRKPSESFKPRQLTVASIHEPRVLHHTRSSTTRRQESLYSDELLQHVKKELYENNMNVDQLMKSSKKPTGDLAQVAAVECTANTNASQHKSDSCYLERPISEQASSEDQSMEISHTNMEENPTVMSNISGIFTPEASSSDISIGTDEFVMCASGIQKETERPELFLPGGRNTNNSMAIENDGFSLTNHSDHSMGRENRSSYAVETRSRRCRSSVVRSPQDEVIGDFHKRGFQYTNECFAIIDSVYNLEAAYAFRPEVASSEDAEYHKVVKFPMCLDTITYRLRQRLYIMLNDVIKDMRRIFWNCRLYYPDDCQVRADCDILEKSMEAKIAATFPQKDFSDITGSPPVRHFRPSSRRRTRSTDNASPPLLSRHGKLPGELRSLFG